MGMKEKLIRGKVFYGWYIVAAGFIIMATAWIVVFNTSSLFIKPISESLGFTRSQISVTITIRSACQMMVALFSGKILTKFNIKKLMVVGTITLFLSIFSYSLVSSLIMFYLLSAIASISVSFMGILPLALILNNWFNTKQGLAIGIAFMGSGIGGMIFGSLAGQWIVNYGWRTTHQILASIMLLCSLPCILFIVHTRPEDVGLYPLGGYRDIDINGVRKEKGVVFSEAVKSNIFWGLIICAIFISLGINTLMISIAPHLNDIGYSTIFSANIVALSNGSLAIGKLALGRIYDSLGTRIATTIACVSILIGLIGLLFAQYHIALFAIIFGAGLGTAFGTVANPIITSNIFGLRDYASINGVLQAATAMGGVIGPTLSGYIYDRNGSYNIYFIAMIVIIIFTILMYQFVFSKHKSRGIDYKV